MVEYESLDLTDKAKNIAGENTDFRASEGGEHFGEINRRKPVAHSIDASKGKKIKTRVFGVDRLQFGTENIDLSAVEQIVDDSQLKALVEAMLYAKKYMNGEALKQILDLVEKDWRENSLDVLSNNKSGDLAEFRKVELAAAINCLRTLKME